MAESALGRAYRHLYGLLCGRAPRLWPWHFQWLSSRMIRRSIAQHAEYLNGALLDVGCGNQPYRYLFDSCYRYLGIDLTEHSQAQVIADATVGLPFKNASFDIALMTQLIEYLPYPAETLSDIHRILRPGGKVILSFPFLYNLHGKHDMVRFTGQAMDKLFPGFSVCHVERLGGIGSTLATLGLNWLDTALNQSFLMRLTRPLLLPVWLPFCAGVNACAYLLDTLDRVGNSYVNVLVVLEKPTQFSTPKP